MSYYTPSFSCSSQDVPLLNWLPPLYATVLRECVQKLMIVSRMMHKYVRDDKLNQVDEKGKLNQRIKKFIKDCTTVQKILNETCKSMFNCGSFETLQSFNNTYRVDRQREKDLSQQNALKKHELRNLKMQYRNVKTDSTSTIKDLWKESSNIKDNIINIRNEHRMKVEYFEQYENARIEENEMFGSLQVENYNTEIRFYDLEMIKESVVNESIENYLHDEWDELLSQVDHWMNKYDEDVEERDSLILEMRLKIERIRNDHDALKSVHDSREEEIQQYLLHKEQMRLLQEAENRRVQAATKIQAWWRGTMYRRGLGPYKKKKGKGKSKNSNVKKKK